MSGDGVVSEWVRAAGPARLLTLLLVRCSARGKRRGEPLGLKWRHHAVAPSERPPANGAAPPRLI